jgi:hypothetical protein
MPSFFEIQPGQLINLSLVRSINVQWNEVQLVYADGTERIVSLKEHTTSGFSPYEVGKRLKALATYA